MKKLVSTVLCVLILFVCALPVQAAGGVPKEVMEATKSVVRILAKYHTGSSTGSGFVIKNEPGETLIVTNDHVVEGSPYAISVWVGEDELVEAEIVCTTSEKDLCVLRVTEPVSMKPLKLAKAEAQHGAAVYAAGYPAAGDVLSDTQAHTSDSVTITDGILSAIRSFTIERGGEPVKLLQVNAAINSGNSGGPLFNTKGEVIGVNTYKVNVDSQGVFGSVAVSELWNLLDKHHIEMPMVVSYSSPLSVLLVGAAIILLLAILVIVKRKEKKFRIEKSIRKYGRREQTVSLTEYMRQYPGGMGVSGAVSLLLPAAIQLRNLHNDGKLHLQICPENIRIGADGGSIQDPGNQETGRYNNGFAAPEIYRGMGFGVGSDIYSFAAVLLYAATGRVPANSLQQELLQQDFSVLKDVRFAGIIRNAMEFQPQDRCQSMQEIIWNTAVFIAEEPKKTAIPNTKNEPAPVLPKEPAREEKLPEPEKSLLGTLASAFCIFLFVAFFVFMAVVLVVAVGDLDEVWPEETKSTFEDVVPLGMPREVSHTVSGEVTVHSFTEQLLSNGKIHYSIAFTAPKGLRVSAFNPPDGNLFMHYKGFPTTGEQQLWEFDVLAENILPGSEMTVNFYEYSSDVSCAMVSAKPYAYDLNMLPKENNGEITEEAVRYSEAEVLESQEHYARAAIAFGKLGYYKDARNRSFACWEKVAVRETISAGAWHTVAVKTDGSVLVAGANVDENGKKVSGKQGACDVKEWTDMIAVSAGDNHTVGLKANGTVVAAGFDSKACAVDKWRNIVAIAAGETHTVGLKSDGTVVAAGSNTQGECNVESWENIIAVAAGRNCTLGLTSKGTVVVAGWTYLSAANWKDIVSISCGWGYAVGLKKDGTVLATAVAEDNRADVENWSDIVAISGRSMHTVGLRSDGTVVAVGVSEDGQCKVDKWKDIVAVSTNGRHTVGLRSDGKAVACGSNIYGRCNVSSWKDIKLPN